MRREFRLRPKPAVTTSNQESVWDYPRPPRLEFSDKHIQIKFNDVLIVDTIAAYRVLETSHPPGYYIPQEDIRMDYIVRDKGSSLCEWKGQATYYSVVVEDKKAVRAAWAYHNPTHHFAPIRGYLSFYVAPMDQCLVNGEVVRPQPGHFYGGWITDEIAGPFKGEPGTWHW